MRPPGENMYFILTFVPCGTLGCRDTWGGANPSFPGRSGRSASLLLLEPGGYSIESLAPKQTCLGPHSK